MPNHAMLAPVIALALWTFVMCFWLYATRIPAMFRGKVAADASQPAEAFHARLPARVRWKADNYNHLMEQPTVFYAVAIALAISGASQPVDAQLAWAYVGIRIVHSLFQSLVNIIPLRFAIFITGTLVLLALTVRAALAVF